MTTTMAATAAEDSGMDGYRAAERRLWDAQGLEATERFVDLAEPRLRMRVVEVGSGEPVVFVGGTGGTGPYWAPLVRELPGTHCLMVDRPGWGLSDPVDYRGRDFGGLTSTILRGVLDALGVDRAPIVGASIGNLWALHAARLAPDRVDRVVAIGGGPAAGLAVPRFIRLLGSPVGAVIVRMPFSPKMARSQLEAIGHGSSVASGRMDAFIDWRVAFARETPSMRHERAMVQAVRDGADWRPGFVPTDADLAATRQPLLMVFGSADPTGSVDFWRGMTSRLPRAELRLVDGAGHMPWWDDAATVGAAVREFLAAPKD